MQTDKTMLHILIKLALNYFQLLFNLQFISKYIGEGQFLPQNILLRFLARYGCDIDVTEEKICANVLFVICGFDSSQFNYVSISDEHYLPNHCRRVNQYLYIV